MNHVKVVLGLGMMCGLLSVGCGGGGKQVAGRPAVYRSAASVVYQGNPVEGALIGFVADGGTHSASGVTDADGRATLTTFEPDDGAVAGNYRVTISKAEVITIPNPANPDGPPLRTEQKHAVPAKYSDLKTSQLTAEVKDSGDNEFKFDLAD